MKTLTPDLAFALRLAIAAGAERRCGDEATAPAAPDRPGGPVLLTVDRQGAIVDMVEASGIGDALCAIESSTTAARLLILLVPVAGGMREAPRAQAVGTPRPARPTQ